MDQPTPDLHPTLRCTKVRVVILLALAVIGYAWMLRHYTSPFAGGSDSSGYLNSAALLRDGRLVAPVRVVPGHTAEEFGTRTHQPLGFNVREGSEVMVPTYPIGLPLHLLAFAPFVGLDWAAIPLNLVTALAGGFLFYVFGRRLGLSEALAGGGAALLLASPLYLFAAFQPLSDLLALVWSTLALLLALRAREGKFWALACGAAVAVAVLVRPTNLLLVGPVALALGLDWRRYLWVGLGGLPGALLVVGYNRQVYGSPFATGYGSIAPDFGFRYVWPNVWYFARWIPGLSSPLVVAALAAPFVSALRRREAAVLASWAVLLIAFYAFYVYAGEGWWYLRFILPAFPALLLLALVTLQAVTGDAAARVERSGSVARGARADVGHQPVPPTKGAWLQSRGIHLRRSRRLGPHPPAAERHRRRHAGERRAILLHRFRHRPVGQDRARARRATPQSAAGATESDHCCALRL